MAWLNQPTRLRILNASQSCFAKDGYDAARVDGIAAAARVSKSHLYYHFPSKADLLTALIELRTAEMMNAKSAVLPEKDFEGDIANLVTGAIIEVLAPQRDFLRIVLSESLRRPEVTKPLLVAADAALDDTEHRFISAGLSLVPGWRAQFLYLCLLPACYLVAYSDSPLNTVDVKNIAKGIAVVEQHLISSPTRAQL